MNLPPSQPLTAPGRIERAILVIRGQKVVLDMELAQLYGVSTKRLNEQVKRNLGRFPEDFMFKLTQVEKDEVVAKCDHLPTLKYSTTLPFAFTEHGALMAANVLNSESAVEMSVHLVRTFVRLREASVNYQELNRRLRDAEKLLSKHDLHLAGIITKLREMTEAPKPKKTRQIGFVVPEEEK